MIMDMKHNLNPFMLVRYGEQGHKTNFFLQ